jgi:demethylmenaquinone methyltransferase/2-methoxy-6-polyprenyl-1,4-benzoquinol methylase
VDSSDNNVKGLSRETWEKVIEAIEDSIPLYDKVNGLISFGKAQVARIYAVENLHLDDGSIVLDSGIGPGTTSRLIFTKTKPGMLIGLDGSAKQLEAARLNLAMYANLLQLVRASFEYLPFRENVFDRVITCYALRDSLDLSRSISEYSRVCGQRGVFADVDIGKSDNPIKRMMSVLYVKHFMPLLAKMAIRHQMRGNPWKMIAPTFDTLPPNGLLLSMVKHMFPNTQAKEFLNGGVIVLIGRKS